MNAFVYRNGSLHVENLSLQELAQQYGTPLYVYSAGHLHNQFSALASAMAEVNPIICYSVKACSNTHILREFLNRGAGFDIVSGGELFRALRAGAPANRIVFAGVGKTTEEIRYALRENILFFTVESEPELERIARCAAEMKTVAHVAFRINPDVDPITHKYITTGKKESKFGMDPDRTLAACDRAANLPGIDVVGLHMHIGSQILSAQPFADALAKIGGMCAQLKTRFPSFQYMDIGGGIGIKYEPDQQTLSPKAYAAAVLPALRNLGLRPVLEPGRFLVGNAGALVCSVQYIKNNPFRKFVVTDAAMNDLIRPSLYEAYHEILPVRQAQGTIRADIVGPICESGDFMALDRDMPEVAEGDFLAILNAGAYGSSMASNYNSRRRPAEILVDGESARLIRQRETWDDLLRPEEDTAV